MAQSLYRVVTLDNDALARPRSLPLPAGSLNVGLVYRNACRWSLIRLCMLPNSDVRHIPSSTCGRGVFNTPMNGTLGDVGISGLNLGDTLASSDTNPSQPQKPAVSNQETDEDQEETPAKKRKRAPARKKATDKESATKESASEAEEKQA